MSHTTLILGGDGRVAQNLIPHLRSSGFSVYCTSRHRPLASAETLYLDFLDSEDFEIPVEVQSAVLVGGPVSYASCDDNFDEAFHVNCEAIPRLVARLLARDIFVIYLSTNTVFQRMTPQGEGDVVNPAIAYARIKAKAEQVIAQQAADTGKTSKLAVFRMTKNVGLTVDPFPEWRKAILSRTPFHALTDLYFAPVRYLDSAYAIERILEACKAGIFHLSGERDVAYHEFAVGLLRHIGLPTSMAVKAKSTEIGLTLRYNHPCTAIRMDNTTRRLGLKPISLATVYAEIATGLDV
jgi:dTDP-4-dehydrorhamnose reductase